MDKYDLAILETLKKDSSASLSEISKEVGLSRFTVRDRIERLFEDRIIIEPTVVVNPSRIGLTRTVFFEFKTNPHEPWLARLLETTASCDLLEGISGEYSLCARFRLKDDEHFSRVLRKIDDSMGKSHFKKYRVVNAIRIFKENAVVFMPESKRVSKLDRVDFKILDILLNHAKYLKAALPPTTVLICKLLRDQGVSISQPAVSNRLSRLRQGDVILGYTIRIDHSRLNAGMKSILRIKANPSAYSTVGQEFLARLPEISDLYRTGEEYGLLAILNVKDVSEYNSFLLRVYESRDIIDTSTTLVLEERKNSSPSINEEWK